ncbi:DMT family transporter [Acidaminobacter sp.]|uniref:DMT family transporter n=1 Tax=Acidaminobacter sp. TaxID=1872102 RepID=UPI00255DFA58|nr:DMT family transporter [Acidaminobacter sp.]MDK9710615.1 DMT family transporter [Acidaminobacter sp.]
MNFLGESAAFATAICWTLTGISFEQAGKRVGSFAVNLLRLIIALLMMTIFNYITRGTLIPMDATPITWLWLSISGLIGFVLGDLFLFQSYLLIGVRVAMVIMASSPIFAALMGFVIFGERLTLLSFLGMLITLLGIALVVFLRSKGREDQETKKLTSLPLRGLFYAFIGAFGQASGLILSKLGMGADYSPLAATQIRLMAGLAGFLVLYAIGNRWSEAKVALKNPGAMGFITMGAFFGPFMGVSFSLIAVQLTKAAIASTIMALVPIMVIPFSIYLYKERVSFREIFGAVLTVTGVAVMVFGQ